MDPGGASRAQPVVTSLFTTPVKGFSVSAPTRVTLGDNGAAGDRDFYVVDASGRLLSITRTGAFTSWRAAFDDETGVLTLTSSQGEVLEDKVIEERPVVVDFWASRDVVGRVVGGPWSSWLSDIAGRPVELVRADDPGSGFDETSVTVLSDESVAELARRTGTDRIDNRRFRMLINISGVAPYAEESWHSRRVRVGDALLLMKGPVPRCNATTRDPESGTKDLPTLRLIAEARGMQPNDFGEGLNLGAYAEVLEPGVVHVGDTVSLEHPEKGGA